MPAPRRPHANEDGPTLLFQRAPSDRPCTACPFRQVAPAVRPPPSHHAAILPMPPLPKPTASQATTLPRPALLTTHPPRGDDTLLLPDALKPSGPEAATVARPFTRAAPAQRDPLEHDNHNHKHAELASPDITIMQAPARPAAPRPRARPGPDARAYFMLNLCLGFLIVTGLAILVTRQLNDTAQSGPNDHGTR